MAEENPQSAADDAPDIEQQLDQLLKQSAQVTSADEAAPGDDPLADQIQQVLDEAESAPRDSEPSAATDVAEPSAAEAPEPSATPEAADPLADLGPQDEDELVDELDRLLAEGADDAVAGDFETVEQVLGEPDDAAAAMQAAATTHDVSEGDRDDRDADANDDEPFEIEGDFAAPEQVLGEQPASEEIAQEEAPASEPPQPVAPIAEQPVVAVVDAPVAPERPQRSPKSRRLKAVVTATPETTKRVCAVVNKPMNFVSNETRNLVGYVGLITLFNASIVVIYKILTSIFAGQYGRPAC